MNNLQQELEFKDMQIKELQDIINGKITEKGSLQYGKWEINYSSILTKLIQEAGRWCKFFASDLFILWDLNIETPLKEKTINTGAFVFAFRESGVDGLGHYAYHKDEPNYYRAVWFLDIIIEEGKITMTLHK